MKSSKPGVQHQPQSRKPGKVPQPPAPARKGPTPLPPQRQMLNDNNLLDEFQLDPTQEAIVSLIQEYLLRYNLHETLRVLQNEWHSGQVGNDVGRLYGEMLDHFDRGEQEMFFAMWNRYLPYNLRMKDEEAKKLEFYLQIYFLIYEIHPKVGRKGAALRKNTISFFKAYLETKGQELSKTTEFLPYYALPYVQRPQEHQSYKHFFTNVWILELKNKLVKLTQELFSRDQPTVLEQMYTQYTGYPEEPGKQKQNLSQSNQNYTTQLEINNQELLAVIQDYNLKYNQMQKKFKEYMDQSKQTMIEAQQKWYQLNKEVTDIANRLNKMLEESRKGKVIQQDALDSLLKNLARLSQFFSTSVEEIISQSQDISMYEKASLFENDVSISPIPTQHQQQQFFSFPIPYVQLNYPKLQQFFLDPNTAADLMCRVLQALRFRITTAKGARVRREILIQYAQFDILGCTPRNNAVLQALLVNGSNQVKEYTLRLTNAMASDYEGRSYLMASIELINILIDILKKEKKDSLSRRNALGALQKLSLRRESQIIMINNDVIRWIVQTLEDEKDSLSEYSYEYATALLMNLSMRIQGKRRCVEYRKEVLKVINDLLEHDNMQVRTFVNGTLYSLFSIKSMREQAQSLGMRERLNMLKDTSDERFKRQIQYILDQIDKTTPDEEEPEEENDVDDVDDIDDDDTIEEEDAEDALKAKSGELVGEDLLQLLFALNHQDAVQQNTMTKSILQQVKKSTTPRSQASSNQPFRPTTPVIQASELQKSHVSQVPAEMAPKNQLTRTPVGQARESALAASNQQATSPPLPEIRPAIETKKDPPKYEQADEYITAFTHKPKIPRTPPQK